MQPDLVTYNTAMDALSKAYQYDRAMKLFHQIEAKGNHHQHGFMLQSACRHFMPSHSCCSSFLFPLSSSHIYVIHTGLTPNLVSYNTAINACGRAGSFERAHELLREMQERSGVKPDTVSQKRFNEGSALSWFNTTPFFLLHYTLDTSNHAGFL